MVWFGKKKQVVADAPAGETKIDTDDRRIARLGTRFLLIGFGGFVLWAALAPLDQGVAANGTVVVADKRKTVQSLTSGLVQKLNVREGDTVKQGQALIVLDATTARAQREMSMSQFITSRAVEDRLEAEIRNLPQIVFSKDLTALENDPRVAEAMNLQRQLFRARRESLQSEIAILGETMQSQQTQLEGLVAVRKNRESQVQWFNEELKGMREMAKDGYIPRNRLLQLERNAAESNGSLADTIANIGRIQNNIAETKLRQISRRQEFQREVAAQLTDVQKDTRALKERLDALNFDVANTVIRAPIDGMVVGLNTHTVGGVVQGGQPLMDVVPTNEPMMVEAQVDPSMSAKVHPGMPVDVNFVALNQTKTPVIEGTVETFSADRIIDPKTGQPFFLVQVKVTKEGMQKIGKQPIRSGMPVTVVIRSGERTMLQYLIKPLTDRMHFAFTEE